MPGIVIFHRLWFFAFATLAVASPSTWGESLEELVSRFATSIPTNRPVVIEIGKFPCRSHQGVTLFSRLLRERMQTAFSRRHPFQVVSRDRAGELAAEKAFQKSKLIAPGRAGDGLRILRLDGVVQGTYLVRDGRISVDLRLAWLDERPSVSVSGWLEDGELARQSDDSALKPHESTSRSRLLVHVLTSGFPPDAMRLYPETIQRIKDRGYDFGIWTEIESLLSDDSRFELLMDPRSIKDFVSSGALKPGLDQRSGALVITSHFVKPENVSRDEMIRWGRVKREGIQFPIELRLELYDFSKPRWPAAGISASAVIREEDPIFGVRAACQQAVRSLLSQLDRVTSPKRTVRITEVVNQTGESDYDGLGYYSHVKLANALEKTGSLSVVSDGFLQTVVTMIPSLERVIYDFEVQARLLRIEDKAGASLRIGPFSRGGKTSRAKVEIQMRDLSTGVRKKSSGNGEVRKISTGILAEVNRETLLAREGVWILDESDLGQAIAQALDQATQKVVREF
jgi:hypothetical protein